MNFTDTAARLAGQVARLLGWPPDTFWQCTPAELAMALADPQASGGHPLTRTDLDRLMERDADGR